MPVRRSVEVEGGRPVVRQHAAAEDPAGCTALEAEAGALARAAGPGVVAVVRSGPTDEGWELVTEHGGTSLAAGAARSAAAIARLGSRAAAVLADLHDRGIVHGALDAEAVVVGADGHPRLRGFVAAARAEPADDVAALAGVLLTLVAPLSTDAEVAALVDALRRAADADPARRPVARRLGAELQQLGVERTRPTRVRPRTRACRGRLIAAATVGIAGVAILVGGGRGRGPIPPVPSSTRPVPSSTAAPVAELPVCVAAEGRPTATSRGCPADVTVDRGVVVIDGERAVVGRPDDEVLVADWGCEGTARPAVLRPATGEVLVLEPLATGAAPVVARADRVEGASGLSAALDDDGCAALHVVTEAGSVRVIGFGPDAGRVRVLAAAP